MTKDTYKKIRSLPKEAYATVVAQNDTDVILMFPAENFGMVWSIMRDNNLSTENNGDMQPKPPNC